MCDMIHSYVTRLILISHDSFVSDMTHSYVTILIHMWPYLLMSHVRIINETIRPTQSIMYVPLQVNRSQKCILLIVQYKYIKPCSGDFNSPESDPPHKIMRYWIYYSTQLCFGFPPDRICQMEMICIGGVPVLKKAFRRSRPLNILHDS